MCDVTSVETEGSYVFSEVVSFSLGLSGMSLKEEQLSAIKAVYEGRA